MLDIDDLMTLVRLTEVELHDLQEDINGTDKQLKDDAGEMIGQVENLSAKLKGMYQEQWDEGSHYPSYEQLLGIIKGTFEE